MGKDLGKALYAIKDKHNYIHTFRLDKESLYKFLRKGDGKTIVRLGVTEEIDPWREEQENG